MTHRLGTLTLVKLGPLGTVNVFREANEQVFDMTAELSFFSFSGGGAADFPAQSPSLPSIGPVAAGSLFSLRILAFIFSSLSAFRSLAKFSFLRIPLSWRRKVVYFNYKSKAFSLTKKNGFTPSHLFLAERAPESCTSFLSLDSSPSEFLFPGEENIHNLVFDGELSLSSKR